MTAKLDDEDLTPITCPRCGSRFTIGAGGDAAECPICRGRSMRPSQWKRSQERALTAGSFVRVVEDLLPALRELATPRAAELVETGKRLAHAFDSWRATQPEPAARSRTIDELAAWHRAVIELTSPAKR